MATLLAISCADPDRAALTMASIDWLDEDGLLDVKAACWVSKENGELMVHQRGYPTAAKKTLGGSLGLIVGGMVGLPVVGLAAGIALGGFKGRKDEHRIDEAFITAVGSALDAGGSAVFILAGDGTHATRSAEELARLGGTVYSTDLAPEQLSHFQAMLDQANQEIAMSESQGSEL
ncbi:MAG: DUF1269 domain-containing protein [Thermomicrobiales bacterium]